MEMSHLLILLLASVVFFLLLVRLLSRPSDGNGGIPSPPSRPFLGHLHLLKKPLHRSVAELAARYDVRRTGLLRLRFGRKPVVVVSSAAIAQECLTVHDLVFADRPGLTSQRLLTDDCPNMVTANYGPFWRHLRRIANVHALSPHRLSLTTDARDSEARAMARRLYARGAAVVRVKAAAYDFVVNVIMAMVAGRRMEEKEVVRFRVMTETGVAEAGAANRHDFLPVLRLLDFGRTAKKLAGMGRQRNEFGQSIIDEYRRGHRVGGSDESTPWTVIGDLLQQQEQSPESYDDVVIRSICLSLLQAGTETSTSTIEWAMALLLSNPSAMAAAAAEIDAVVGTSRLLQERDLAVLPYLRCIITETLRMCPLAPLLIPHGVSSDCAVTGDDGKTYTVKRGTMVLFDVYSMQRDGAAWENPGEFVPERFGSSGEKGAAVQMVMTFGMGRRRCPGEGLAWRSMGVALGVMLQCFEWERVGKEEVDMSEGSGLTMPMAVPLMAACRPRQEMDEVLRTL